MRKKTMHPEIIRRLKEVARDHGTPTYVYNLESIAGQVDQLGMFDRVRYAQKALSNLAILHYMRGRGLAVDAVSAGEILRAVKAGYQTGGGTDDIVYTADIFDEDAIALIRQYGITVNVGSPDMISQLGEFAPGTKTILRINPGFGHGHSQKVNTGGPLSKHGIWHEDVERCLELGEKAKVNICGVHMHIGSGSDLKHLSQVCGAMERTALLLGGKLEVISAGGGLPISYQNDTPAIDVKAYYDLWHGVQQRLREKTGNKITLEVEPGRFLVARSGYLLTQIRSIKKSGETSFYLVDAGFDTLIRPAMYGAYHRIEMVPQGDDPASEEREEVVVAGPLCESCDVFTQSEGGFVEKRPLPMARVGDYLVLRDAGAYGSVMSSNYNSRRLAAEVLLGPNGPEIIRERQKLEDVFALEKVPLFLKEKPVRSSAGGGEKGEPAASH